MLEPNQIFAGRYRIVRHIASGGMGAVFEAEHVTTEARVALKLLLPHVVQVPSARRRFELEAKVAARVNSEHIVRVFDAGVDTQSGAPFLAMELLSGQTLAGVVKRSGPLEPPDVVTLMWQVARGLDAAHGYHTPEGKPQPIVHRDLKPENLFISWRPDATPLVKILDFGVAKVLSESTEVSQDLRGTPLYMAFEQAAGEALSPQTDIWAFGLIAFYALTGRRYWPAANGETSSTQALFAQILTLPLPLPSTRLREDGIDIALPAAFDQWLLRCIDRIPSRRFASAEHAARALELSFASRIGRSDIAIFPATVDEAMPPLVRGAEGVTGATGVAGLTAPPAGRTMRRLPRTEAFEAPAAQIAPDPSVGSVSAVTAERHAQLPLQRRHAVFLGLLVVSVSLVALAAAWRLSNTSTTRVQVERRTLAASPAMQQALDANLTPPAETPPTAAPKATQAQASGRSASPAPERSAQTERRSETGRSAESQPSPRLNAPPRAARPPVSAAPQKPRLERRASAPSVPPARAPKAPASPARAPEAAPEAPCRFDPYTGRCAP